MLGLYVINEEIVLYWLVYGEKQYKKWLEDISFQECVKNNFGIEQAAYRGAALSYESLPESVN